jgi:hypothetical protein
LSTDCKLPNLLFFIADCVQRTLFTLPDKHIGKFSNAFAKKNGKRNGKRKKNSQKEKEFQNNLN